MKIENEGVRLTQFSQGAGCGCKISPKVLTSILQTEMVFEQDPLLLVGNDCRDDAAVYDLENGSAIISTTDFFTPIVDDPFTFGRIAATNAISDVYAMGGKPLLAIAILGWPVKVLSAEIAQKVLEGGRSVCAEAGISLAGGHSIESPEPIFGLAVTGMVEIDKLKKNDTASAGCKLLLTKPIGVGILTTAQKHGILSKEDADVATEIMSGLNSIGPLLASLPDVRAMTDVTGFGLLGHLVEMCEGANLSAEIEFAKVPKLQMLDKYLAKNAVPGGTNRNWDSYGSKINLPDPELKNILCDPQTSGGLLIAVAPEGESKVIEILKKNGIETESFGKLTNRSKCVVNVI
ncbi:MAG: selenide, water dikinase SelD [Prolixibacteraceae bacterium]|nr:selenide, water dikinase SelD [Prolixibacteraceae bacterium]